MKTIRQNTPVFKPISAISRRKFFQLLLPWVGLLAATKYRVWKSRLIDRVIAESEEE